MINNATQTLADTRTQTIVAAATAFLDSLSPTQRAHGQFPFTPQATATAAQFRGGKDGRMTFVGEQYGDSVWSNFPISDVPRPGLTLGSLSEAQRNAALHVLQVLLSPDGYQKVFDIMESDQVLAESGTPYAAGTACYTLGIFGTPSITAPWMLQFGGHHLALNATVFGPSVTLTPVLTGCHPATYHRNGQLVHPLGRETDKASHLMSALSAARQQKATLSHRVDNLVLGPGHDGENLSPEGLPASEMTDAQRFLLLDLITEWVGLLNREQAAPQLAQIRVDLDRTYFAWYGDSVNLGPMYFRITGPTVHIEFTHQHWDSQATGTKAGGINHIHTIYRDLTNDYGRAMTTK